jgi:hypothetical protein
MEDARKSPKKLQILACLSCLSLPYSINFL